MPILARAGKEEAPLDGKEGANIGSRRRGHKREHNKNVLPAAGATTIVNHLLSPVGSSGKYSYPSRAPQNLADKQRNSVSRKTGTTRVCSSQILRRITP